MRVFIVVIFVGLLLLGACSQKKGVRLDLKQTEESILQNSDSMLALLKSIPTLDNVYIEHLDSVYRQSMSKAQSMYDEEILLRENAEQKVKLVYLVLTNVGLIAVTVGMGYGGVYIHRKYKRQKEQELEELLIRHQDELESLETELGLVKEKSERNIETLSDLKIEREALAEQVKKEEQQAKDFERLIAEKEVQIGLLLKDIGNKKDVDERVSQVLEGLDLDAHLKLSVKEKSKLLRIEVSQFKSYIAYHRKMAPQFVQALRKCMLTDYEIVICLLFSTSLTHKQVCEVLCKTSETLSRNKLRLKNKIKTEGDEKVWNIIKQWIGWDLDKDG